MSVVALSLLFLKQVSPTVTHHDLEDLGLTMQPALAWNSWAHCFQPHKCQDYRHGPPHGAQWCFLNRLFLSEAACTGSKRTQEGKEPASCTCYQESRVQSQLTRDFLRGPDQRAKSRNGLGKACLMMELVPHWSQGWRFWVLQELWELWFFSMGYGYIVLGQLCWKYTLFSSPTLSDLTLH